MLEIQIINNVGHAKTFGIAFINAWHTGIQL